LSQRTLTLEELRFLEESLKSETRVVNIRLRQGEYQFDLAKGIASFELQLGFPNIKGLVGKLYGEKRTQDIKFIRKIQTILKKMEKSNIVRILPKKKPWELQRYALSSFRFQDVDKNLIVLVTESDIKQTLDLLHLQPTPNHVSTPKPNYTIAKIWILVSAIIISYGAILWTITQPTINPFIFVSAFCVATICSILLGITISRRK